MEDLDKFLKDNLRQHRRLARMERLSGYTGNCIAVGCTALTGFGVYYSVESNHLIGALVAGGTASSAIVGRITARRSFERSENEQVIVHSIGSLLEDYNQPVEDLEQRGP